MMTMRRDPESRIGQWSGSGNLRNGPCDFNKIRRAVEERNRFEEKRVSPSQTTGRSAVIFWVGMCGNALEFTVT